MVETTKNGNRFAPDTSEIQDIQLKPRNLSQLCFGSESTVLGSVCHVMEYLKRGVAFLFIY